MRLKKSFSLIELIVVIVIMGILATITFDVLSKIYKNYIYTKEINKLDNKLDAALEEISSLLRNRVVNSVIATKYPDKVTQTDSSKVDFKPVSELTADDTDYHVLEWIGKDYEARYGMWDDNQQHIQTGWSGFFDLDEASRTNDDPKEFNVTTINSNFDLVKLIDRNITAALGEDIDPFENNITTLIFSGYDLGGDLNPDVNRSFGWYFDEDKNRTAKSIFAIQHYIQHSNNNVDVNITSITENNNTTLYARYFLVRTAYSIVPIENNTSTTNDYNLTLYYNYQPWRYDWWNKLHGTSNIEANHTLLLNHVTQFRFKKDSNSPLIRIYMCVQSNLVDLNATNKLEICKEKVVF
jgi:prepilin-type N-terminal cleavage/methylation domain-containing protein